MDFGLAHGIRLHFEGGLLAAVLLDLHRKPRVALREELNGTDLLPEALTLTEIGATVATQELGVGRRKLEISESRNGQVAATLQISFELRMPIDWQLEVDAIGNLDQEHVVFDLPNKTSIAVQANELVILETRGVKVSLPQGHSQITISITSEPVFAVSQTIIVCRPDQMREAAIVASCLPTIGFIPIIAIDSPPMTKGDYISHYKEFRQSQDEMMSKIGGAIGRVQLESADSVSKLRLLNTVLDVQARRHSLTAYRSWAKRNRMLSSLLSGLQIERAIFLHTFTPDELITIDPGQAARQGESDEMSADYQRSQMFGDISVKLDLSGISLPELTLAAWRSLHKEGNAPERIIEVPTDGTATYVTALFAALRTGATLSAVENPKPMDTVLFAELNPDAEEAVLVEDTGDVTALLGALYAHHRSARLIVTPRPDLESVRGVVAEHQSKIEAAAQAVVKLDGVDFSAALRQCISEDGRDPYTDVEIAVTKQVPLAAINEVGNRRLTAFTTGLPYSFVHADGANWTHKPIGHVSGDADLLILNEIYSAGLERSAGAFSLIFDPGFFRVSETSNVMRSIGEHFTYPILLSGPDANLQALMRFPSVLPVELIFFNTHGSDNEIALAEDTLSSSLIVQWLQLDYRPIVFNNSCQSWTGVGREFVRVGARGYIGTLWSIPSDLAASFARIVVDRLTAKEEFACTAIIDTGLSDIIERSYIYAGTANGRLDQWRDRDTPIAETALMECAMLANAVLSDNHSKIRRPLRREIHVLRELAKGTPHEWTVLYADALLSELSLLVKQELPDGGDIEAALELANQIDEVLQRSGALPDQINWRSSDRYALTGELYQRFSAWPQALQDYERSISYGDACHNRANLLIQMASISMHQGKQEEATQLARAAYKESKDRQDKHGIMAALGVLGQLSKRLNHSNDAMNYTKEGYALAVELQDLDEQGTFKLDESFIHAQNGDLDAAIAAATQAVELFRINRNDQRELVAIGKLGTFYRQNNNLDSAEIYAAQGLAQAERLAIPREIGTFHLDLGMILAEKGRHREALTQYREAVMVIGNAGSWELGAAAIPILARGADQIDDADGLWLTAIWGSQFCEMVQQPQWSSLIPVIVTAIKKAIIISSVDVASAGMQTLASKVMSDKPQEQADHMRYLGSVAYLLWNWMEDNDRAELANLARHLDQQSNNVLELEEFVRLPYSERRQ